MMYGTKCWAVNRKMIEQRMCIAEMRMLRWMSGMTIKEKNNQTKQNYLLLFTGKK